LSFVSFAYGRWLLSEPRCSTHMHDEGGSFLGEGGKQKSWDRFFFFIPSHLIHFPISCVTDTQCCVLLLPPCLHITSAIQNNGFFINGSALELSAIATNKFICLLRKASLRVLEIYLSNTDYRFYCVTLNCFICIVTTVDDLLSCVSFSPSCIPFLTSALFTALIF
jgi:hypothetical protein